MLIVKTKNQGECRYPCQVISFCNLATSFLASAIFLSRGVTALGTFLEGGEDGSRDFQVIKEPVQVGQSAAT